MKSAVFRPAFATFAIVLNVATLPLNAQTQTAPGTICFKPGAVCNTFYKEFAPYELPFQLPRTLAANTPVRSAPFYAVVLRRFAGESATECDAGEWTTSVEGERRRLQKLFSGQKVFANHQCPDMGAVQYILNGKNDNTVFIAVYAGRTAREAQKVKVRANKVSRQVQILRMSLSFERIVQ